MTDYHPALDDEIEICGRCGGRLHRLGPEAAVYCYRCGNTGKWPTVRYRRAKPKKMKASDG